MLVGEGAGPRRGFAGSDRSDGGDARSSWPRPQERAPGAPRTAGAAATRPARTNIATPIAEVAVQASSPTVTSTSPIWSRALIRKAATIPRAPVMAFQPAIAAAREASGVWSLTTAAIPTSIEALAMPGRDRARTRGRTTDGATA